MLATLVAVIALATAAAVVPLGHRARARARRHHAGLAVEVARHVAGNN